MQWRNTWDGYGLIARGLHWLILLLLAMEIGGGLYAASLPFDESIPFADTPKAFFINLHKSMALIVLALILLRLAWKLYDAHPLPATTVPYWQRRAATAMHNLLYVLMFAQPLSGLAMSQAAGYPISFFGLFTLPTIIPANETLGGIMHTAHEWIWVLLVAAVVCHATAALHHHFRVKDDVLKRMLRGAPPALIREAAD